MIGPDTVRGAKRIGAVVAAVSVLGSLSYAAASAVAKSAEVERRVIVLELRAHDLTRLEGKVDALLTFFRVPQKEP